MRRTRRSQLSPRRVPWPADQPLPSFTSLAEEERFWLTHEVAEGRPSEWEELVYEPQATRHPRQHVYRIRFDDREMAALQALAQRRGVTASVVVRELLREAIGRGR